MKIQIAVLSVILVLIMENIGRNKEMQYLRMSYFLETIAFYLQTWFVFIGTQFAKISSFLLYIKDFLIYLDIAGLYLSLLDIITQIANLFLLTPFYFAKGYFDYVKTYVQNEIGLIYAGTILLFGFLPLAILEIVYQYTKKKH